MLALPSSRKTSDVRSRTSSMRTGDATRVLECLNIDGPDISLQDFDEYQNFKRKEQTQKYDRKASQDFFAAESKRMEE